MRYVQVVVNTPLAVGKPGAEEITPAQSLRERAFTYSIPEHLADSIALGQLVWVPFGARRLQGVVIAFSDTSPVEQTKDIDEIADARPLLSAAQIDLAHWIARTYLCSLYDALSLMLPPGIEQPTEILLSLAPDVPRANLTPKQAALVELITREGNARLNQLPRDLRSAVDPLAQRGILVKRTRVAPPRAKPKRVKAIRLVSAEPIAQLHPKTQTKAKTVADFLRAEGKPVWISALYAAVDCDMPLLHKLEDAGIIALEEEEVWRDSLAGRAFDIVEPPKLTPEQERVWEEIKSEIQNSKFEIQAHENFESGISNLEFQAEHAIRNTQYSARHAFLLHGVTGSGKTEIYMRALAEIIAQGKQGIVLVPEISLTPQTLRRFGARFKRIAVLHSRLADGERYDTWRRCRDGLVDVVIGARSALFAPLPNLALIAMDEEHDPSYKQAEYPHYHARAVALELARRVGATVILGDATPDVETYYRATRGEFRLLELPKRIMGHIQVIQNSKLEIQKQVAGKGSNFESGILNAVVHQVGSDYPEARYLELPPVEIVDLRAELKAGNRAMFSRALQRAMARVLAAREQVILFLNRRGTATFILCRDCGKVFQCKRCDNPMTYHGTGDQLVCHHCNRRDRVPTQCPQCGSARIRYFGVGTEKVEAEVQTLFPKVRTLRWDFDVTRGKESHEAILEKFVEHQADVLIGTQMIAKGLDLPLVTLVGVISADTALNLPDFRSGERTFQLLTQVAGRAGRSILGGKVIVQTYNPEHYAIQAAAAHDYRAFYEREIAFRREQDYPPFSHLIRLLYAHSNERQAQQEAARMFRALETRIAQRGLPSLDLIGPAPAFFHRVRGQYRYQILVRGANPHTLVQDIALPLGWRVDVEPVSML